MERRRFPRIPIVLEGKVGLRMPSGIQHTSIEGIDLSCTGIGFMTQKDIPLRTECVVKFEAPYSTLHFSIAGNVRRKQYYEAKQKYYYGISFKEEDYELVLSLVKVMIQNQNLFPQDSNVLRNLDTHQASLAQAFLLGEVKLFLNHAIEICQRRRLLEISEEDCHRNIKQICHEIIHKAHIFDASGEIHFTQQIKTLFKIMIGNIVYQSRIFKIAKDKPTGYPEDCRLRELLYHQKPVSEGMGYYFDYYFLTSPYAEAVRTRTKVLVNMLSYAIQYSSGEEVAILDFMSNARTEIKSLIASIPSSRASHVSFEVISQDEAGLLDSKNQLLSSGFSGEITFHRKEIVPLVNNPESFAKQMQKKDIVYHIGVVDYLPDKMLQKFLQACVCVLKPAGVCIIGFLKSASYAPLFDWFCDWYFVPREEDTIAHIARGLFHEQEYAIEIQNHLSNDIFFLTITKK